MAQQGQRVGVGPVHVVEHEQHRRARRHFVEQLANQLEGQVALARARGRRVDRAARGQQPGERTVVGAEPAIGGLVREPVQQALEHLDPGLEGHQGLVVAASQQHQRALSMGTAPQLRCQRGLPDPRLAGHQGEAHGARESLRPDLAQALELGLAALGAPPAGEGRRKLRRRHRRRSRGLGGHAPAPDVLHERPARRRRRHAELTPQPLSHRFGSGQRRRPVAGEREQGDQLAVRRLGERLEADAPSGPADRSGEIPAVARALRERAEHPGQLRLVLVTRPQCPVGVEALEQLALPRAHRGLELACLEIPAELADVDPHLDPRPGRSAGRRPRAQQRPPDRVHGAARTARCGASCVRSPPARLAATGRPGPSAAAGRARAQAEPATRAHARPRAA